MGLLPPKDKPAEEEVNTPRAYNPGEAMRMVPPGIGELNYIQMLLAGVLNQTLYTTSTPTFVSVILSGLTASQLVGTNASKQLESVSVGTSLSLSASTLNTIQGIRTSDTPQFAKLSIGITTGWPLDVYSSVAPVSGTGPATADLTHYNTTRDQLIAAPAGARQYTDVEAHYAVLNWTSNFATTLSYLVGHHGDLVLAGSGNLGPMMMAGLWGTATYNGTGTSVDTLMGVRGEITVNSGTGVKLASLYAAMPELNGGTTALAYGLYIEDINGTGAIHPTTPYQIYSAGASLSYLAGPLQISNNTWGKIKLTEPGITSNGRLQTDSSANFAATQNAYWDGDSWERDDTTKSSFAFMEHAANNQYEFRIIAAGSGSITWLTPLRITTTGLVNVFTDAGLGIIDTNASHYLRLDCGSDLSADRILSFVTGDAARTLTLNASVSLGQDLLTTSTPQFLRLGLGVAASAVKPLTLQSSDIAAWTGIDFNNSAGTFKMHAGWGNANCGALANAGYIGTLSTDPFYLMTNNAIRATITGAGLINIITASTLGLVDTNASHYLRLNAGSDLSADRILTLTTGDAARTITLSGNPTLNDWFDQEVKAASTPSFASVKLTTGGSVNKVWLCSNADGSGAWSSYTPVWRGDYGTYNILASAGVSGAPATLTVGEQSIVGRITGGDIAALTGAQVLTLLGVGQAWTTPTFAAGDFTANGAMTWTVESGDVTTYAYTIIGKIMTVSVFISGTVIGGTPNSTLYIKIPASKTCTKAMLNPVLIYDNSTWSFGYFSIAASATEIQVVRLGATNWTAGTAYVFGQITFEIN